MATTSPVSQSITLLPPTYDDLHQIEYSMHTCSPATQRELKAVFPSLAKEGYDKVIIIPTFQRSTVDLVNVGPDVEAEKERLLDNFMHWANSIVKLLRDSGYWADLTDPCSGLPVHTQRGSAIYSDVQGHSRLLHYPSYNVGSIFPCIVITHPLWGSASYPATMFTTAPFAEVVAAVGSVLPRKSANSSLPLCDHCH